MWRWDEFRVWSGWHKMVFWKACGLLCNFLASATFFRPNGIIIWYPIEYLFQIFNHFLNKILWTKNRGLEKLVENAIFCNFKDSRIFPKQKIEILNSIDFEIWLWNREHHRDIRWTQRTLYSCLDIVIYHISISYNFSSGAFVKLFAQNCFHVPRTRPTSEVCIAT